MAFEHKLPLRVTRRRKDGVTLVCTIHEDLLNETGTMHGGVIASIADEAVWHAINHHFGRKLPSTTTELKVNFLRPIRGRHVTARSVLVRAGRTLCVGRVDFLDENRRLAAVAIVTYMLL